MIKNMLFRINLNKETPGGAGGLLIDGLKIL